MRRAYLFGVMMLGLSLLLLLTTVNIGEMERFEVPFSTGAGVSGTVSTTLPKTIYAGDIGKINVELDPAEATEFSPAILIVHLEAGFEDINPAGIINVSLRKPEPIRLEWSLRTATAADYPGTLWIWIDSGDGKDLVLAKEFRVKSMAYLGVRVVSIRIAFGSMGILSLVWLIGVSLRKKPGLQPHQN